MGSTGSLSLFCLCFCWLLLMASVFVKAGDNESEGALCMLDKSSGDDAMSFTVLKEAKCVPLRILTEEEVITPVGEVCVDFTDATQKTIDVVYSTVGTDYTLVDLHLYAGSDIRRVPMNGLGMPSLEWFEYQLLSDDAEEAADDSGDSQVKSLTVSLMSPQDPMSCPSEVDWKKYLVAHATVQQEGEEEDVDVYAHEKVLSKYNNVELDETEYFSYVQLDLSCQCQDSDAHSNIFDEMATNETRNDATNPFDEEATMAPTTETMAPSLVATLSPTAEATTDSTLSQPPPRPPVPPQEDDENPPPPPLRPVQNLAGEDLVVGMSFIVVTDTSAEAKTEFDREEIQRGFAAFARNVLERMLVYPLPRLELAAGMRNNDNDSNNGSRRRQLWVKYDNSSIHVYTFLVSTYCSPDDAASVIQPQRSSSSSSYAPPPVVSQCHRAYARLGVRIVGEDPIRVCEMLRDGTLLGYQKGMLQQAMLEAYPNTTIQLHPGDFEYCVPVADFVVPNHTAPYDISSVTINETAVTNNTPWVDSNPLANLTKITVVEEEPSKKEIPWILILVLGLLLFLSAFSLMAMCYFSKRQQKQQEEEEDKVENEPPPEIAALMT